MKEKGWIPLMNIFISISVSILAKCVVCFFLSKWFNFISQYLRICPCSINLFFYCPLRLPEEEMIVIEQYHIVIK